MGQQVFMTLPIQIRAALRMARHSMGEKASPTWSIDCALRSPFQLYSAGIYYVTAVAVNSGLAIFMLPFLI